MSAWVPLRTCDDTDGRVQELLESLDAQGTDMPILRAVANADEVFPAFLRYAAALMRDGDMPARTRELVVLRAAVRLAVPYEWAEHERFAREAGVLPEEVTALAAGQVPGSLDPTDRLVLDVTDDVIDAGLGVGPSDTDRCRRLIAELGPGGYTRLTLAIGWWVGCVPLVVRLLGLEAPTAAGASPSKTVVAEGGT